MTINLLVVRIASFTFLACPHYTENRCSCRHENVSGSMSDNRIELEQVVHTDRTSYQSGRLAERPVWCTKSQCSLLKIYFHNRWVPAYARSYSFHLKTCSHCDEKWQKPIRYVMIHFSRPPAAQFRSLTEIAEKSPFFFLCELTEAKSCIIFVSVRGLSGIVWLIVAFRVPQTPDINLPHNSVATIQCYERFNRLG